MAVGPWAYFWGCWHNKSMKSKAADGYYVGNGGGLTFSCTSPLGASLSRTMGNAPFFGLDSSEKGILNDDISILEFGF